MSTRRHALLALLADGALHSGAQLAARLGVSRAAVWKLVGELRSQGIDVQSEPRRGYRLPATVELLDAARIERVASSHGAPSLYEAPAPRPNEARILFAEIQHAGRGRRGRSWVAPFGSGLTFSVAWAFAETPPGLPALGLAIGVAVAETLLALGADGIGLKWPNDIVWQRRKLGGLLLQLRMEAGGPATVVVGLGLNLDLPPDVRADLEARGAFPVTDLHEAMARDATSSPARSWPRSSRRSPSSRATASLGLRRAGRRSMRSPEKRCV